MDSPEAYRKYAAVKLIEAIQKVNLYPNAAITLETVLPAVDAIVNANLAQTRIRWAEKMAILRKLCPDSLFEFLQPDPLPELDGD